MELWFYFINWHSDLQLKFAGGTPPTFPVSPLAGHRLRSGGSVKTRLAERVSWAHWFLIFKLYSKPSLPSLSPGEQWVQQDGT
jgi:hypothetical protein